jgi:hypothetical protein
MSLPAPDTAAAKARADADKKAKRAPPPFTFSQRASVTVEAFQWDGTDLAAYDPDLLPGWLSSLSLNSPAAGALAIPVGRGVDRLNPGDWLLHHTDGSLSIMTDTQFSDLYDNGPLPAPEPPTEPPTEPAPESAPAPHAPTTKTTN